MKLKLQVILIVTALVLRAAGSPPVGTPPAAGGNPPQPPTEAATLEEVLAELRALRSDVADLRRQLSGVKEHPTPPVPPVAQSMAPKQDPPPMPTPVLVTMNEAKRHALGKADAPVVLVEFTDYECGFCKRFFDTTFARLKKEYIDTGKLRFVSRNMPNVGHPQAGPSALALLTAAERADDDYWSMRGWLFANQRSLNPATLGRYAEGAGMNRLAVLEGMAGKKHQAEIDEDLVAARAAGITATPSFVLGTSDGQLIRGERIVGAKSFQLFDTKIQALLAKGGSPVGQGNPKAQ